MSGGWEVGDLALCVLRPKCDAGCEQGWKVCVGGTYTVSEIALDEFGAVLNFKEDTTYDPYAGFDAFCFRKIRPDEQEGCEPEFVTLLKRSKVVA